MMRGEMERVLLGHGSGGRLMHQLIRDHVAPLLGVSDLGDSATIDPGYDGRRLAFTTDCYVVSPLFFPGGNIGELSVYGTVNDLSVAGARPLFLSAGFIIEEGFPMETLQKVLVSMAEAAGRAGIRIVAGDTKVVEKGKGDGLFITTCGIGTVAEGVSLGPDRIEPGDKIIVSGPIGRHGVAVMAERNGLAFDPPVLSDTAPLNGLVELMIERPPEVKMMRDPTRGGVATTLKEIALESGRTLRIDEDALPVPGGVRGACELLGLDPLYVANEGILIAIVAADAAASLFSRMKDHALAKDAAIIGEVGAEDRKTRGMVLLRTGVGGTRIVDMLPGEQLPRIC